MNSYNYRVHDPFDGDPNVFEEYHQDYREGISSPFSSVGVAISLLICLIPIIYHILSILDYDLLPLPELLWNVLVYLTPSRLLNSIEDFQNPLRISDPALRAIPKTHAAKSESMRRILGLDTPGGIIGSVAQAGRRRLSTLPGINIAAGADGRPAGLGNWDNSCYQNSVLQGLASLDSLTEYLTNPMAEEELAEAVSKPDMKMAAALRKLIATLKDPSNNGRRIWTPATLKNMSSWQQQDAQEYFSKVLDEIDKEVGKVAKTLQNLRGFESDDEPISSASSTSSKAPMRIYRNPLEGLIAQRVGCTKCGFSEGLSMIPFNCLTLPLGRSWGYDISECLDEYTKLEPIEGVECGKCTLLKTERLLETLLERNKDSLNSNLLRQTTERLQAVREALEDDDYEEKTLLQKCKISPKSRVSSTKSRQAVIARPPKSLVAHINRSVFDEMTGELKKNYAEVRFPKVLDLAPWCLGSASTTDDNSTEEWRLNPDKPMIASSENPSRTRGPIYELRAVVTHYGRHENGHYICYKKHPSINSEDKLQVEPWWRLSDDDVMKVSEENVLGQGGVFMLFYDQIEPAGPKTLIPVEFPERETVESNEQVSPELEELELNGQPHQPVDSDILAAAVNIPLPEIDDTDLSDFEDQESITTREQSIATSVSEFDDEDTTEDDQKDYEPAKAIFIPAYIPQTGGHNESDGSGQKINSPASLVMV